MCCSRSFDEAQRQLRLPIRPLSLILCTSLHEEPGRYFCFAWAQMHTGGGFIGLDRQWLDKVSGGNEERMAVSEVEVEGMTICARL